MADSDDGLGRSTRMTDVGDWTVGSDGSIGQLILTADLGGGLNQLIQAVDLVG